MVKAKSFYLRKNNNTRLDWFVAFPLYTSDRFPSTSLFSLFLFVYFVLFFLVEKIYRNIIFLQTNTYIRLSQFLFPPTVSSFFFVKGFSYSFFSFVLCNSYLCMCECTYGIFMVRVFIFTSLVINVTHAHVYIAQDS